MQRISIIGLGNIGSNVAQSLLQSNLAITLYNRTKSKAEPHIINGATVKDSVSSALMNADIIISCLFDDESMLEVFSKEHIASMPKGAIHASTATITPSTAKILEQRHNELGVKYISANVLGSGETALDKTMITFVSGNQDAVSAITPIFELFSRDIYNFGEEITTAINSKIMANYVAVSSFELIAELLVFSERNKLDPEILAGILEHFYCSPSILNYYKKMRNHEFDKVNFTVNGGLKDSKVYIQAFKDVNVQAKFAEILHDRFVNAKRLGLERNL